MILFHILDEAEVDFPFDGLVELEEPETHAAARSRRRQLPPRLPRTRSKTFRETYRRECFQSGIDYVPLDTSMQFDRALTEYLAMRRSRA